MRATITVELPNSENPPPTTVVRHEEAYYAKQRKQHDEYLRDTGQLVTQPRRY